MYIFVTVNLSNPGTIPSKSYLPNTLDGGMNKYPLLKLINSSGEEVFCNKTYKDNNTIIVNWKIPFDGFLVIGE